MKKPFLFLFTLLLIVILWTFLFPELSAFTNLEAIKIYHDRWLLVYEAHPLKIICLFILFNIFMASLPVPGISMISFLGGTLFGFFPGMIYSSLATAIGNLIGFFMARYSLQEWVMNRYRPTVRLFKKEWQREGAMALFSFRLFPFVPSFVANFIMGVSNLHWWTFFWVSWVGRIPMVLVYTWAGVQFTKIESVSDILSPSVLSAFILLALLPWIVKRIFKKNFKRPSSTHTH